MLITRVSDLTGIKRTLNIPCTQEEYDNWINNRVTILIQDAFPNLTAGQREFILSGITDEEWDDAFHDVDQK